MKKIFIILLLAALLSLSCFPYVYFEREKVLLEGVDIDTTLKIAEIELTEGGFDSILTLWAMRDQFINDVQAQRVSELYFLYIDDLQTDFQIWHLAWAVSNMYRLGGKDVKALLNKAYLDAKSRPQTLKQFVKIADEHISGDKIYMGDVHDLGRFYAHTHIVVPGNKKHVQSLTDYYEQKKEELDKKGNQKKSRLKWDKQSGSFKVKE